MKTDLYTKTVLTIIAICLSVIVLKDADLIPTAEAAEIPGNDDIKTEYKLVPVSDLETLDVRIVDIYTSDELNVNIKNIDTYDEMKVNLKKIDTDDELDINIDEIGGAWLNYSGPIPVKIE